MKDLIKWHTAENADATKILKQHAFVTAKRGAYYMEKYDGNKSLCSKNGISDGDKYIPIEEVNGEILNPETACKKCQKIFHFKETENHRVN